MADTKKELQIIISARDQASQQLRSIGTQFTDMAKSAATASSAILASLGLVAKGMIDTAGNMEQSRISFETMLGSGDKAGALLKQLSDFAVKTPFDLPQVIEGSKRLLAYNVSAEQIIPTFTTLGNIASAVGTEKLPQLILAFGQVKAATHLTGMELRQFSEAGVPLLQTLVDKANETGGTLTKIGGASKQTVKKVASLSSSLVDQTWKLKYMADQGKKNTTQYKNLSAKVKETEAHIKSFGNVGTAVYAKVKTTAEAMIEKISAGEVSFDQVTQALESIGGASGKWGDLMARQATTFEGTLSNVRDEFIRFSLSVVGVTQEGEIRKGSVFYYVKEVATEFLSKLQEIRPVFQKFVDSFLSNKTAIMAVTGALLGLLTSVSVAALAFVAPALAFAAAGALIVTAIYKIIKGVQEGDPVIIGISYSLGALAVVISASLLPVVAAFISSIAETIAIVALLYGPMTLLIGVIGILAAGISYVTTQTDLFKTKAELLKDAQDRLKASTDALTKANNDLAGAEDTTRGALLSKERAVLTVTKSQDTYNEAVKKYGDKSQQATEAALGLKEANYNLDMANKNLEKSVVAEIAAQQEANTKAREATTALTDVETVTKRNETAWGNFIGKIDEVTKSLKNFALQKAIEIGVKFLFSGSGKKESKQHGGFINAPYSQEVPAVLHGGERVIPRNGVDVNPSTTNNSSININFTGPINMDDSSRVQELARQISSYLGRQNELASKGLAI